jgi:hypothetical protein
MSFKIIGKAFDLPLKANDKLVFLALCEYANDDDFTCYPSFATLMRKASISRGALSTCLNVLENLGLISRALRKRQNGSNTSNLWTVHIDKNVDWELYKKRPLLTKRANHSSESELPKSKNHSSESELGVRGHSSESELHEPLANSFNPELKEYKESSTKKDFKEKKASSKGLDLTSVEASRYKANILEFIEHRKEIKKPMTQLALKKFINLVDKLDSEGCNIPDLIDNSITAGYSNIFKPRQQKNYKTQVEKNNEFIDDYFNRLEATQRQNNHKDIETVDVIEELPF